MLGWVFGNIKQNIVHIHTHDRAAGYLEFDRARVRWFLSIEYDTIPADVRATGKRTYRSMEVEGEQIEFSDGFTELHTTSYNDIISGGGFRIDASKQAIEIVHDIRTKEPIGLKGDFHPFAALPLKRHPFSL